MDANTTIQQLGGRIIFAMAFETPVTFDASTVYLKIARGLVRQVGATHVAIKLEADDTYTVRTLKMGRAGVATVKETMDVYCDSLRGMVESMTGLRLTLGGRS